MTDDAPAVRMEAVTKRFRDVTAVAGIDLSIQPGEDVALLADRLARARG